MTTFFHSSPFFFNDLLRLLLCSELAHALDMIAQILHAFSLSTLSTSNLIDLAPQKQIGYHKEPKPKPTVLVGTHVLFAIRNKSFRLTLHSCRMQWTVLSLCSDIRVWAMRCMRTGNLLHITLAKRGGHSIKLYYFTLKVYERSNTTTYKVSMHNFKRFYYTVVEGNKSIWTPARAQYWWI